ncbi:hypothetical protein SAMN05421830_11521 [Desulfomicrobium norvegicum]|uniref:Uncharacterized protein n=1 Tax=Desulfomicrobium norvegicum (strain DSM 1741 / NCIMB 8310) TaxID=52561 RepID=A0A8G2C5H2_DESNO|nr:hypothetical protein [Desulfomicrobium norvegicum]SFM12035.1 hypothetical protein SAMN05421830_11521 [Desulfomicrobium norvegicum]
MPLINEVKIIPCSFRHIIPVRFALCTHTDCTIPDNVLRAFKPGANLPKVNHTYTLRTLDNGYVFATWNSNPTEENIAVFAAKGGRLTMLDGPRSTGFASRPDTIAVPREVSQLYMLFIRIPESEEQWPDDRTRNVWKEMRKNLAADPFGQMQLVTLGKAVNPGLRQYSYEASPTCFHADDLPNHVEEYAEEPGCLLRLRQEGAGVNLFEERKPAESKEWSPQELCGRLSPWKRWDASASPFSAKPLPESTHHDTHVACLADPVGMIYDMVAAYSDGLEDLSLYARWHEPMIVSGELTRLYVESKGRKDNRVIKPPVRPGDCHYEPEQPRAAFLPDLAPYNNFKRSHSEALEYLEDRLNFITGSWQALVQDTRPIYSFQFQLGNFFLSDDQKNPCPVDPATAFNSDEIPADPLTVARLAILAGAFHNIASRPQSFAILDKLLAQDSPLAELFQKTVGEGAVPGNEYGLILTSLTGYLAERARKEETIQGVLPLISAFNKRLGLPAAEPANTLGRGLFLAETWMNKSEYAPVPGLEEIREDSDAERAMGILKTSAQALSVPMQAFLAKDLEKLEEAKAKFDEAQQLQRDAQRRLAQSGERPAESERALAQARANLNRTIDDHHAARRAGSTYGPEDAVLDAKADLAKAQKNMEWLTVQDVEIRRDPLGVGKSMNIIFKEAEIARIKFDGEHILFIQKYQINCGDLGVSMSVTDLRVAHVGEVLGLQTRLDDLRESLAQGKEAEEAAEKLEKAFRTELEKRELSWRQSYAQYGVRGVEFGVSHIERFNAETTLHHAETRHHFITRLGQAVNALDGVLSAVNLVMAVHRLPEELRSARRDPMPFVRDLLSATADGLTLIQWALATRVTRSASTLLARLFTSSACRVTTIAIAQIVTFMDFCKLYKTRDYDAALFTAASAASLAVVPVLGWGGFVLVIAFSVAAASLQDGVLESAAKNNYWATDARTKLDACPIHTIKSPFAVEDWFAFFKSMHENVVELFSPQISVDVVGKRLRVTTRCVRLAMLGPASAGVGVIRNGTFSLDGGQLAREPEEQEKDGMLECVLEFDMVKILLQAKDTIHLPTGRKAEVDWGRYRYLLKLSTAVFHMHSADMELFTKYNGTWQVISKRDILELDFSEQDIVSITKASLLA